MFMDMFNYIFLPGTLHVLSDAEDFQAEKTKALSN
jgi:hypothetical protein